MQVQEGVRCISNVTNNFLFKRAGIEIKVRTKQLRSFQILLVVTGHLCMLGI